MATGHAHDVSLDDTLDFLNTDDTDDGFPVEKLPTLDAALDWFVDRGVIHLRGRGRRPHGQAAADPASRRAGPRAGPRRAWRPA